MASLVISFSAIYASIYGPTPPSVHNPTWAARDISSLYKAGRWPRLALTTRGKVCHTTLLTPDQSEIENLQNQSTIWAASGEENGAEQRRWRGWGCLCKSTSATATSLRFEFEGGFSLSMQNTCENFGWRAPPYPTIRTYASCLTTDNFFTTASIRKILADFESA